MEEWWRHAVADAEWRAEQLEEEAERRAEQLEEEAERRAEQLEEEAERRAELLEAEAERRAEQWEARTQQWTVFTPRNGGSVMVTGNGNRLAGFGNHVQANIIGNGNWVTGSHVTANVIGNGNVVTGNDMTASVITSGYVMTGNHVTTNVHGSLAVAIASAGGNGRRRAASRDQRSVERRSAREDAQQRAPNAEEIRQK